MAADERRRYDRTTEGNVAYDLNYQRNAVPVPDGGEPYPQPRRQTRTRSGEVARRRMTTRTRVRLRPRESVAVFPIVGFALAAVLAVMVLVSNVQLNSVYSRTVSLQSQLTQLQTEGEKLRAEYEAVFNQEMLNEAVKKAGTLTPANSNQIVYVELSDPDNVIVYNQEEKTEIERFLDSVRGFFTHGGS